MLMPTQIEMLQQLEGFACGIAEDFWNEQANQTTTPATLEELGNDLSKLLDMIGKLRESIAPGTPGPSY